MIAVAPTLTLHLASRRLSAGAHVAALTPQEATVFAALMRRADDVVSFARLHAELYDPGSTRLDHRAEPVLRQIVCTLRRKLASLHRPEPITLISREGYMLETLLGRSYHVEAPARVRASSREAWR